MYVQETDTPNGTHIRYEAPDAEHPKAKRRYLIGPDDLIVPSVTDVLDILDKPGLKWWGQQIGVQGMLQLFNTGAIWHEEIQGRDRPVIVCPKPPAFPDDPEANTPVIAGEEEITYWLTKFQITVNHKREKAADRGLAAHDAFELWCREGLKPQLDLFPDEEQGYIQGLLDFIEAVPFIPTAYEIMVCSLTHRYAGRYDARGHIDVPTKVCHHIVPDSRNRYYSMLQPCSLMVDLKTSRGVYNGHSRQLEAYELASVEGGWDPTDTRAILHITEDGLWELKRSFARPEAFLATLRDYEEELLIEEKRKRYGGAKHK